MCGIVGYVSLEVLKEAEYSLVSAVEALHKRGPDFQSTKQLSPFVGFGHARLSIIDTSVVAHQPMTDGTGRYTIVFNGEIFNFQELRKRYLYENSFDSHSDTEVLLQLYIKLGKKCLNLLNGFFAFAIYDAETKDVFLARDRYGIKPLHLFISESVIVFASELKAIFKFPVNKELDQSTLLQYLQLNYVPANQSMLKNFHKLAPGYFAVINSACKIKTEAYYTLPYASGAPISKAVPSYEDAKSTLSKLVEESVQRRLVSDVPLGCFLSGGIDSSIVTACAAKHVNNLNTFSIGYCDEPFYDETEYAQLVAQMHKTNHTVFSISSEEMFSHVQDVLDYFDEPFADSSAIAVYILSKKTRQKVTVALSGDGGDELFAGYNKHAAELLARKKSLTNFLIGRLSGIYSLFPQSRHSKITNTIRQLARYSEGLSLSPQERYWRWCAFQSLPTAQKLFSVVKPLSTTEATQRVEQIKSLISGKGDLNDVLMADMKTVLPGDMLTKVDLMSMANSLEVRVPLLDYTVVDFAFSLPVEYKIAGGSGKRILKDAFRNQLPIELFSRSKKGFEIPLAKWIKTGLRPLIENEFFEEDFIREQNLFNWEQIQDLKTTAWSKNPGDAPAVMWGLIVFQNWYKKYFMA